MDSGGAGPTEGGPQEDFLLPGTAYSEAQCAQPVHEHPGTHLCWDKPPLILYEMPGTAVLIVVPAIPPIFYRMSFKFHVLLLCIIPSNQIFTIFYRETSTEYEIEQQYS